MKGWRNCPFCGNDELLVMSEDMFEKSFPKKDGCVKIECPNCSVEMYEHDVDSYIGKNEPVGYEELIRRLRKRWNTRKVCRREEPDDAEN